MFGQARVASWASYVKTCQTNWGVTPIEEEQLREKYHFTHAEILNSTQIIFSQGQYDPTTAVGPDELPLTVDKCKSRKLLVSGMAHREDLFLPTSSDKASVIEVC